MVRFTFKFRGHSFGQILKVGTYNELMLPCRKSLMLHAQLGSKLSPRLQSDEKPIVITRTVCLVQTRAGLDLDGYF